MSANLPISPPNADIEGNSFRWHRYTSSSSRFAFGDICEMAISFELKLDICITPYGVFVLRCRSGLVNFRRHRSCSQVYTLTIRFQLTPQNIHYLNRFVLSLRGSLNIYLRMVHFVSLLCCLSCLASRRHKNKIRKNTPKIRIISSLSLVRLRYSILYRLSVDANETDIQPWYASFISCKQAPKTEEFSYVFSSVHSLQAGYRCEHLRSTYLT